MSRTGSFPLRLALRTLSRFATSPSTVFDPFCGKGTVPLACRLLGHVAYAMDVAPEAVICSRAKMESVSRESLLDYLQSLRIRRRRLIEVPSSVRVFFHEDTLSQLLGVRAILLRHVESRSVKSQATVALAMLLGILHGHASYSLSLPCAHAYSMAPGYVMRYAAAHGLSAPSRDVRHCLITKATRCLRDPIANTVHSRIERGSVDQCLKRFPELIGKVDIILTSPPYLAAQTYAKDNWLRLWFMGLDYKTLKPDYIETSSVSKYRAQMAPALALLFKALRPGGVLLLVTGDARVRRSNGGVIANMSTLLMSLITDSYPNVRIEEVVSQCIRSQDRYFHALSKSNGHSNRDLTERVLVARKVANA